jgi:pilus assembly protein CpaB
VTELLRKLALGLGVIAIVAGLALGVAWLRAPSSASAANAKPAAAKVLVATHDVAAGALLRDGDLAWRPLTGGPPPAGAILEGSTAKETLYGAAAPRGLRAGEVLLDASVVRPSQRNFLAATLTPGQRAVTISVDAPQSASGLISPGDRVDVILVQEIGEGERRLAAEAVLHNTRVLAVGRSFTGGRPTLPIADTATATAPEPKTVTLEASPHDAERLLLASRLGELQLALRAVGDVAVIDNSTPVWAGEVSDAAKWRRTAAGSPRAEAGPAPRRGVQAQREGQVLILRGNPASGSL